jgi:hypothetical protein
LRRTKSRPPIRRSINLHQSRLNGKKPAPISKIREKRNAEVENKNHAKAQGTAQRIKSQTKRLQLQLNNVICVAKI